jgi:hypothetical protein
MTLKTANFFGTSGISPIITGAATLFQLRLDGQIGRGYLWLVDSSDEPVETSDGGESIPVYCVLSKPIESGTVELDFGSQGLPLANGLYVCVTPTEVFSQEAIGTPRAVHVIYTQ